ncbi:MAG: NAD(+)/NADH kinase [Dehalococcoidales bacterium]|nr:MAG: NAD(+)/NADH kinase [Dehalococcoidales bacterium]
MKRVGILYHPMKEDAYTLSGKVEDFLKSEGLSVWSCSAWETEAARGQVEGSDLLLSIGGDGTILRAAQVAIYGPAPVTGINVGKLGFMTELSVDEAIDKLPALLAGESWIDERSLLEAELSPATEGTRPLGVSYALNDVVVTRSTVARVVYVTASVDGEPLTTYKGDGVIVATATGSTGYSLAAGGPILHPQARELMLVPILPHISADYTLVLPSTVTISLGVSTTQPAMLSIDGHLNWQLSSGDTVTVKRSARTVQFLRIHSESSFYGSLDEKLEGKK